MVFGERHGDAGCTVDGNGEAELLAPKFIEAELWAHKHGVRCIGQGQSMKRKKKKVHASP